MNGYFTCSLKQRKNHFAEHEQAGNSRRTAAASRQAAEPAQQQTVSSLLGGKDEFFGGGVKVWFNHAGKVGKTAIFERYKKIPGTAPERQRNIRCELFKKPFSQKSRFWACASW
jgi:hypothetical protein